MKIAFAAGLVLAAALLATGAPAAPAPATTVPANSVVTAPDWSAGSEWHYSDGYAVKVGSVSPKGAVFQRLDAPGQWFTRQGFIRTDSASATATRNAIYRTVPDTAGLSLSAAKPLTFQREYLSNGKLLVHASSWSVEGHETITVPAGTFDCWVIVWRTRSLRSDWTGFERWWYSPQAQNYVRMEFKYGPEPDGSRVLMKYSLAAPSSVPVAANPPPTAPLLAAPQPVAAPVSSSPPAEPIAPSKPKLASIAATPVSSSANAPVKEAKVKETKVAALTPAPAKDKSQPSAAALAEKAPAAEPADLPARVSQSMEAWATEVKATLRPVPKADKLGSWHAQLGAAQDAANIRASLKEILAHNPRASALPSGVMVRNVEGRTFYRAWLGSYDSPEEARSLCKALKTVRASGCVIFKGATMQARAD